MIVWAQLIKTEADGVETWELINQDGRIWTVRAEPRFFTPEFARIIELVRSTMAAGQDMLTPA